MAVWGFLKDNKGFAWKEGGVDVSTFDDGLQFLPGEDGFDAKAASDKAKSLGSGISAYFIATPAWSQHQQEAGEE